MSENRKRRWFQFSLRTLLVFVLIVCVVRGGESVEYKENDTKTSPEQQDTEVVSPEVEEIVRLLEDMPRWPLFPLPDQPEARIARDAAIRDAMRIQLACQKIAQYDLDTIRTAISTYDARTPFWKSREKLLFLNKFLFDLPETVRCDSEHFPHFVTGWSGMPITGARHNRVAHVRWPWKEGPDGQWYLIPVHGYTYMGSPYRALEMFDYFRKKFGRRKPVWDVSNVRLTTPPNVQQ
jgi:hypothetical protein